MAVAIDPDKTLPYVCQEDRKKSDPPTFHIKPLCGSDSKIAMRSATGESASADGMFDIVRICLVGWERFTRADGTPVEFASEERMFAGKLRRIVTEKAMSNFDAQHISELALAASNYNTLTAEDVKN